MSRSRKKNPIYKDRGMPKSMYNRVVRHNWNQELRVNWHKDDLEFRNPKVMINDYTFSDWSSRMTVDPFQKLYFYEPLHERDLLWLTTKEDVEKRLRK